MAGNFNYFAAVNQFDPSSQVVVNPSSVLVKQETDMAAAAAGSGIDEGGSSVAGLKKNSYPTPNEAYYNNPNFITQVQNFERAWHVVAQHQQASMAQQPNHHHHQQQLQQHQPGDLNMMTPSPPIQIKRELEQAKPSYKCPDCVKKFKHVSVLFTHASQMHYANELEAHYWPEVEVTSLCPICRKSIDRTRYMSHIGGKHKKILLFMTADKREQYVDIENQKMTPGRKRKAGDLGGEGGGNITEDRFKCPDCNKSFPFVAPLYIHAACTHYAEQIKAKYLPIYKEHGKCHICGNPVNHTSFISHYGSKHKRILTFMSEEKRQVYMSMKKRPWTNFEGPLVCAYDDCRKNFRTLTMYKQHLANTHVRTELLAQTRLLKNARCPFCDKLMPKPYSLLQHLGACHNQVLNYVPPTVQRHLELLGVKGTE